MKKLGSTVALIILILINLFPLYGVFYLHWQIAPLILGYWAESCIAFIFAIIRGILTAKENQLFKKKFKIIFAFSRSYFFIILFDIIFILNILTTQVSAANQGTIDELISKVKLIVQTNLPIILPFIYAVFAGQIVSLLNDHFIKNELKASTVYTELNKPAIRLFVLQAMIIFSAFINFYPNYSYNMVIILILGKTIAELISFFKIPFDVELKDGNTWYSKNSN